VPVILELFTAEGCSSCPPADDVLTRLVKEQPVAGAQIVALGEHVDYWNDLGWRDAFSSAEFSARQSEYATRVFHSDARYTPQLIIDGHAQLVGSDYRAATAAIEAAARQPKIPLRLSIVPDRASRSSAASVVAALAIEGARVANTADVFVAVIEDGLVTQVRAGENNGRQLRHSAVVRVLDRAGTVQAGGTPWSTVRTIRISAGWTRTSLRVAAFAQERASRRIVAVSDVAKVPS
jgi:hypothetical protein